MERPTPLGNAGIVILTVGLLVIWLMLAWADEVPAALSTRVYSFLNMPRVVAAESRASRSGQHGL